MPDGYPCKIVQWLRDGRIITNSGEGTVEVWGYDCTMAWDQLLLVFKLRTIHTLTEGEIINLKPTYDRLNTERKKRLSQDHFL